MALLLLPVAVLAGRPSAPRAAAGPPVSGRECETSPTPEEAEALRMQEEAGAYILPPLPRYVFEVPLSVHIVRRDNGTGGLSQTDWDSTLIATNAYYGGAGLQFVQQGSLRYINSTNYYQNIDTQAEIDALKQVDVVANTINIYFTEVLITDGPDTLCGQSSFTTDAIQGVVIANGCTMRNDYPSTTPHELGHYLDLYHTHETIFGAECPDGSNCDTAGDLLCDTAADPDVTGKLNGCAYVGTDNRCGDPFDPDPTNLMSYGKACRDHFTAEQKDRALATLVNLRSNLISGQLAVSWVDFAYGGVQHGTYAQPWSTVSTAVAGTAQGGRIVFKAGSSAETITTNKPLTFDSFRGTTRIGSP